ncbi:hypothetical protein BX600DRAFT_463939 [Xylariales sp. PMI_506]|nr:hypothetical protein BX600DRAFT_463939 [Xylariales sp. PMI_506]
MGLSKYLHIGQIAVVLSGSVLISLVILTLQFLNYPLPGFDPISFDPTSSGPEAAAAIKAAMLPLRAARVETLALVADTSLTFMFFIRGIGGYKNWKALNSVLNEVYLVIILMGRHWAAAQNLEWAIQLQTHSAILSTTRWLCALVAVVYSLIKDRSNRSVYISVARTVLLTTLAVVYAAATPAST